MTGSSRGYAAVLPSGSAGSRIACVILSILSVAFPGIIVYLLLWLLMPDADEA